MRRPVRSIAVALAALASTSAIAQSQTMRADLATSPDAREVVLDGRLWTCNGSACTAAGDDPRPAVACRKLARKLGPVTRFATRQGELDTAGLASCNQDQK